MLDHPEPPMTEAAVVPHPASDHPQLDADLLVLREHRRAWAQLSVRDKIALLEALIERTDEHAKRWVQVATEGKQLPPDSPWVGEEWVSGPWAFIGACQAMAQTLRSVADGELPEFPRVRALPDGRAAVQVFPVSTYDALLLSGYRAEVWMQDGVTPDNLKEHVAGFYRNPGDKEGAVALVLGAGNITSIPALDAAYRLFVMGHVTMVKFNPVNEWLGPVFEDVFAPLVEAGFLRFAYGGGDVGAYLTRHDSVDELHLTGSETTYDRIVFGGGEEGKRRKERDEPEVDKPFTAELGGVGPVIVVPGGPWNAADLRYQAEAIVTAKLHNSGHNCVAAQVVLLPADWEHADALLREIHNVLSELPPRVAWYPGAADRQRSAADRHASHEEFSGDVPTTLLTGVPADEAHFAFTEEFFGVVLAVTRLPGDTPEAFWRNAVAFANDKLHGTLGANVIIHPRVKKAMGEAFDQGLRDLRYGAIGVNVWNAAAYLLPYCTWGAFPGHPRNDISSGHGVVHNAFMFDAPQKTVAYGPFAPAPRALMQGEVHMSPKPLWFVTNKMAHIVGERLTHFAARPSPLKLPAIFAAALRG
jgi:aldehyde dehydrogenase (NAD(P)+)